MCEQDKSMKRRRASVVFYSASFIDILKCDMYTRNASDVTLEEFLW